MMKIFHYYKILFNNSNEAFVKANNRQEAFTNFRHIYGENVTIEAAYDAGYGAEEVDE